jgi:chloramphenicol O-acetyltransferase type A
VGNVYELYDEHCAHEELLFPMFTFGKYYEQDGKVLLPLAVQVHHSVCDGFHVARMFNELQEMCDGLPELSEN